MIFTGKDGSIYEIPEERYAEFEVSPQRAKEILDMAKSRNKQSSNDEVSGYYDLSMLNYIDEQINASNNALMSGDYAAAFQSQMAVRNAINQIKF